ncbi:MAG: hypothetical protein KAJ30_00765, partial [Candidatus Heimdallarchaeota archaeon]|nr:hypothetical protein [Candidatus Heimdallarchaeota archaeon]
MVEYKTLIEIYQSDAGLQKEFPNMTGKGVSGEWTLDDWWNRYGKVDYPNVTLVQPGDKRLTKPTVAKEVKAPEIKTTEIAKTAVTAEPSLLDIYNARPDVQAEVKRLFPGQNATTQGTEA